MISFPCSVLRSIMSGTLPTLPEPAELYRLLMENVTDYAIFTLDTDGRISGWNSGAERILGYAESEALGQPVYIIFTPEDRANRLPAQEVAKARATGRA